MRPFRHALTIAAAGALTFACAETEEPAAPAAEAGLASAETQTSAADAPRSATDALLATIPGDAPYAFVAARPGALETLPWQPAELLPFFDTLLERLTPSDAPSAEVSPRERVRRLAWALASQLDGKLDLAGLRSLGVDFESPWAVYGVGAFPTFRIGLSDRAAAERTLTETLAASRLDVELRTLTDGTAVQLVRLGQVWQLAVGFDDAAGHLVVGVVNDGMLDASLGAIFERPAAGLALPGLAEAPAAGFVSTEAIAAAFAGAPDAPLLLRQSLDVMGAPVLDATCGTEVVALAAQAPRIEVRAEPIGLFDIASAEIRLPLADRELAAALGAIRGDLGSVVVPGDAAPALSVAANVDVDAALALVAERAGSVLDAPFECAALERLNTTAARLAAARLWAPESVLGLTGAHVVVEALDIVDLKTRPRGFARLRSDDPSAAWDLLTRVVDTDADPALRRAPGTDLTRVPTTGKLAIRVPEAMVRAVDRGFEARFGSAAEPWARTDTPSPLFKLGFDTSKLFRPWLERRAAAEDADAQWLGLAYARAGLSEHFGLRTIAIDVDAEGLVLSYARNSAP